MIAIVCISCILFLSACNTTNLKNYSSNPNDPFEETNRKVHAFNKHIDKTTLKPASKVYGNVIPRPIRLGAANFHENLQEPKRFVNHLGQAEFIKATTDVTRFVINSSVGVFGIFDTEEASVLTTLGLHSLQHRGQEGAGIVSYDGKKFYNIRKQGLVGDNFNDNAVLSNLPGRHAIGHVRYSTTGDSKAENLQPLFANLSLGGFACALNGNLTNTDSLKKEFLNVLVEKNSVLL